MALTATFDAQLARIRLAATLLGVSATYAVFDRTTDGINHTVVRGGTKVTVAAGNANLDDYEFPVGIATTYRVRSFNSSDVLQQTFTTAITQDVTEVWVKVVARPFLNQTVTVFDFSDLVRSARSGVFNVKGRSFPVAVSDVRGSPEFTLQVQTETAAESRDFDLLLASGEPVFVQVPSDSLVPDGYYTIGQTAQRKLDKTTSARRVFTCDLIESAAPGPDVVGAAGTWQTVLNAYATWTAVLAGEPTWADVLELIGSPSEVIVP